MQKGAILSVHVEEFLNSFDGYIDAIPPQARISTLQYVAVSFLIEPDGKLSEMFAYSKFKSPFLKDFAFQFPQNSFPDLNTKKISKNVAKEFHRRDVHGFINIDLIVFETERKKDIINFHTCDSSKLFWINSVHLSFSEAFKIMSFWNLISTDWEFDPGRPRFTLGKEKEITLRNELLMNVTNQNESLLKTKEKCPCKNPLNNAKAQIENSLKYSNEFSLQKTTVNANDIENKELNLQQLMKPRNIFFFPRIKFFNPQKSNFSEFFNFCRKEDLLFDLEKSLGSTFVGMHEGKGGLLIIHDDINKMISKILEILGKLEREIGKEEEEDEIGLVKKFVRNLRI